MICPQCRQDNPAVARFCMGCGASLAARCATCGTELPAEARFCFTCGRSVSASAPASRRADPPKHLAERILTSRSALEGERKQVTVLFADLKGSLELLAERDPEEARKLLDPVLEHMMDAVHRYEGTVNQVMGDGIMALFGAPLAHEDHAVRACYAALRMQESVRHYAEGARREQGVTIRIRVGLNSGDVVVRAIGSDLHMDYTAVGQTTHLGARMEQLADPGSILLTPDTLALAEGFVQVTPLGPMAVRGLSAPLDVFELTGASSVRSRLQAAATRGLTRFVGRDTELEQVHRVQQLAADGHGQLVAVVGEAGVGKSRLVYEFVHWHRLHGWLVLEAAAVSYGKAMSYLPVIELLKGYFEIQDRDEIGVVREKVISKLRTRDGALDLAAAPLLALLDVPVEDEAWQRLDPGQRRRRTFDAVKSLLLGEARTQPLLVIVEDLHWIDAETQALLDALVDSLGSARLLLLVNYRPEYQHAWGGKTFYTQLRLDALTPPSAQAFLESLLGDDPELAPLKQLLVKRGNPFFLEETVRTLVETKALAGERGRYLLTQPLQSLQVPATVQTMLAARIDRLAPDDKRLLQSAAVIGKDVPFALLAAIAEDGEEHLRQGLARLEAAEFLYETALFPDLEYTFKHALTHDVAYQMILTEQRRALHVRLVQVLENLAAGRVDEYVDRLAYHALRAELWDKAVEFLRRVGARAIFRSANREAADHFRTALTCLTHLPETASRLGQEIDLHLDLSSAAFPRLELDTVAEHLRRAEALEPLLADPRRSGRIASVMAMHSWLAGKLDDAAAAAEKTIRVGSQLGDIALLALGRDTLGRAHMARGNYREARDILEENVALLVGDLQCERFGATGFTSVFSRHFCARACAALGAFDQARVFAEQALAIAGEHPHSVLSASSAVAVVARDLGEFAVAAATLERALALCENLEIAVWAHTLASDLGYAYAWLERVSEALPLLERGAAPRGNNASGRLVRLSEGYFHAGRIKEALETARRALAMARTLGERGNEADAHRTLGDVLGHDDGAAVVVAAEHYRQALVLAEPRGMRPLVAHCHFGLGELSQRAGERQEAEKHLTIATAMYRDMAMRFWLQRAETALLRSR